MADWTISAIFLAVGTGVAVLTAYLLCKARIERTNNRLRALEREVALAQLREDANQRKLAKIFEAVVELRETAQTELGQLREKLDKLLADNFPHDNRSAA
jgi:hypothetical protein